jgi:hypothetical protein
MTVDDVTQCPVILIDQTVLVLSSGSAEVKVREVIIA